MKSKSAPAEKKKPPASATPPSAEETRSPVGQNRNLYYAAAALLIVVAAVFANSLANDFVFDDRDLIVNLIKIGAYDNPLRLLGGYRPLRTLSYAFDYAVWGEQPFGFHLTNIVLHAISSMLAFFVLRRITGAWIGALLGALIFAVHPMQTDSVTYISGRRDVLFGLFYLAAFLSYLRYTEKRTLLRVALFLGFWALSLLSKEMAVSLPAFIFVWNFCRGWSEQTGSWLARTMKAARQSLVKDRWFYLALIAATLAYVWYMILQKGASQRIDDDGFTYYGDSFFATMLTMVRVHAWYLKQLVVPTPVAQYYKVFDLSRSLADWRVWVSLAVVGGVLVCGFRLLKNRWRMAFAILAYFVLLLPVSQIVPHHELLADHYLYLPLLCFGLLVALAVEELVQRSVPIKRAAYATVILAVVVFSLLTVTRNRVWRDGFTLWQDNYQHFPQSPRAAYNLAGEYMGRNLRRAEELYTQTVELDPTLDLAYTKLSQLYLSQNRVREAEELIAKGLTLSDSDIRRQSGRRVSRFRSELLTAMAAVRLQQNNQEEQERLLMEAVALYPRNRVAYAMLADSYRSTDPAKRMEILKEALDANPKAFEFAQGIATKLLDQREYEEAHPYLQRVVDIRPRDYFANLELGRNYRRRGDCQASKYHLEIALTVAQNADDAKAAKETLTRLLLECRGKL